MQKPAPTASEPVEVEVVKPVEKPKNPKQDPKSKFAALDDGGKSDEEDDIENEEE